jgi:tetratricopeptide (TPR) repeat protein
LKHHEQTLELRKAKLGPDHPDTLASMRNLANSYAALGRHAHERASDAERALRDRIAASLESALAEIRQDVAKDPENSSLLDTWNAVAMAYYRERNWQGAEAEARLAVKLTVNSEHVPQRQFEMAPLLVLAGKHDEYRAACQRILQDSERLTGDDLNACHAMLFLMCLSDPEPPADSDRVLRLMQRAAENAPDWDRGMYDAAQLLLSGAWHTATIERLGGSNGPQDPWSAYDLALAYARDGQLDKARAWLEEGDRWLEGYDEYVTYGGGTRLGLEIRRREAQRLVEAGSPAEAAARATR